MEPVVRYGAAMASRLAGLPPKLRQQIVLEHLRRTWDEPSRDEQPVRPGEQAAKRDKPGTVWGVRSFQSVRSSHE